MSVNRKISNWHADCCKDRNKFVNKQYLRESRNMTLIIPVMELTVSAVVRCTETLL